MASTTGEIRAMLGWKWIDGDIIDKGAIGPGASRVDPISLANGPDSSQIEGVWHKEDQSLLQGGSVTYDLTALQRTLFEDVHEVTFIEIKAIIIYNKSTNNAYLTVGNAAANPWLGPFGATSHTIAVMESAPLILAHPTDGWGVHASNKNLKLACTGATCTFDIAIVGTLTASDEDSSS